jgi:hypothetical protein
MLQALPNKIISASFNWAMDPLTINETTFTIKQAATAIPYNIPTPADKNIYRQTVPALISVINHHY